MWAAVASLVISTLTLINTAIIREHIEFIMQNSNIIHL
jgi:hypothetical protein